MELNVLSFGQNLVRQHDDAVQYLKKLKNKLEVLKMSDNPYNYVGQNEQDYTLYTVEVLKNLKYLDYTLIDDQLRKNASAKHGDAMGDLESQQQGEKTDDDKNIDHELVEARIETTDRMLQKILDANEEAQKLKVLGKFAEHWQQFEEACNDLTQKYQSEMKMQHREKQHVIKYCSKVMRDEELLGEKKSIDLIREFQRLKKHKLRYLEDQEDKAMIQDDIEQELITAVEGLEDNLMEIEMLLQMALQEGVSVFQEKIKLINAGMKEKTIQFHKEVGEHAEAFHENLKTHANAEYITFEERLAVMGDNQPDDDDEEFNAQLELLGEKEGLDAILEQFKEFMDAQINQKEGQIDKAIKAD